MKDIKGYEGRYAVTKNGEVFSYYLKGFLSPKTDKDGYLMVCLQKKGVKKYYQIHRLVALTYIPNTEDLPTVNHKDGIKNNNKVENLEWNSISQNLRHAYSSGIACLKGSKNPRSILTETDVRDIKNKSNSMSVKSVADIYKVTPGTIYNIISGRSWKHVI